MSNDSVIYPSNGDAVFMVRDTDGTRERVPAAGHVTVGPFLVQRKSDPQRLLTQRGVVGWGLHGQRCQSIRISHGEPWSCEVAPSLKGTGFSLPVGSFGCGNAA